MNDPQTIEDIHRTLEQLIETDEGRQQWLSSPNPILGNSIPNDLIRDGEAEQVFQVLDMIATGSFR